MTEQLRADIVDNKSHDITMQKILRSEIPLTKQLDISTGYFYVNGYGMLRDELTKAVHNDSFRMRLLLGKEATLPSEDSFESRIQEHQDSEDTLPIKDNLDESDLTSSARMDTASLINLLHRDNIQVRLGGRRFNHSKCYIFDNRTAFIGSSNFTRGGLAGNYELNAGLYQPGAIKQTHAWFENMWEDAADTKDDLIAILRQSKFGEPASPFEVYMKMLFERFKPLLGRADRDAKYDVSLTNFQQDAVQNGLYIISEFGGVMIADATGLGKTNMGIEIIRQKILKEGRKVLLVAPAQVLHSMWKEKLKDVDINVREMLTMESLGRDKILESLGTYRDIDFVLIDESQNFRSKTANRRKNLMKLLSVGKRKQVVLLSATPINNSLMDLYYQLSIITGADDSYFYKTVGIPHLYQHMHAANKKDLQHGLEKIQQLLDSVMVRRTRSYIKDVYKDDQIDGEEIRFPKHEYSAIRYNLSDMFGNIFEKILEGIESLTMAPYGIEQYNLTLSEDEKSKHRVLAHLQVITLLKRFESSVVAVQKSLENKISLYEYIRKILNEGKILRVRDFNKILGKWNSVDDGTDPDLDMDEDIQVKFFMDEISKIQTESVEGYDVKGLKRDMDSDVQKIRELLGEVKNITVDTKLDEVKRRILHDKALDIGGRKVLIFTQYTATAKYITRDIQNKFRNKTIECITGNTKPETRKRYIQRFAPKSNPGGDKNQKEIDILVSTEVLAEGQNLQDCNYVVNYDLPWNPMRIVQRTGRVDRLTSKHDVIHSRACYPDKDLDAILQLVGTLMDKIGVVDEILGLDAELLGETPSPKQYNGTMVERIRILAGDGSTDHLIEQMERESDIMPVTSPINELSKHIKYIGIDAMKNAPRGRRSGKRGKGNRAVLAYLQEKSERRVYFVRYENGKAYVPDDDFDAIQDAACGMKEPLYLPMDGEDNRESFELLIDIDKNARIAIREKNNQVQEYVKDFKQKRKTNYEKNVSSIISVLIRETMNGNLPKQTGNSIMDVIKSEYIRPWEDHISDILSEYNRSKDIDSMVAELQKIGQWIDIKDERHNEKKPVYGQDSSLKLVGAIFISD